MPLSRPTRRKTHHNRNVMCSGYLRDDGLWDIEARMTDIKTHDVDNLERGGYVPAGEAFHDISIRITVDTRLLIKQVEACIDYSPFRICNRISTAYQQLQGTRIGPGWHRLAKEKVGGVAGCTHMNELLPVLATTAIQTIWPSSDKDVLAEGAPFMLDSCHSWGRSSEMVKHYLPEHYQAVSDGNSGESQ